MNPPFSAEAQVEWRSPKKIVKSYHWQIEEVEAGQLVVTWTEQGKPPYPWLAPFMDSRVGPQLEQGLHQLKKVSELRPLEPPSAPLDPFPDVPNDL